MIVKRDTQTHDLSDADVLHVMNENIANHKTFTCQIIWSDIVNGGQKSKVILRGSNDNITFDNLGLEVEMTVGDGSATLSDEKFPHDFGGAFVEKNGASAGIVILKFLVK